MLWFELVSPRGDRVYSQPVAVLVNRWTGSMGEGLAIGFDATGAGTVVGTAMAGLVGATIRITLPRTGIAINVPTERLYHINELRERSFNRRCWLTPHVPAPAEIPLSRLLFKCC